MRTQVELFRAYLFRCPRCGGDIHYRLSLDGPHAGNYDACRCSVCKELVTRRELLRARIRQQAVEGVAFDCDECGRANFFVGRADACVYCGEEP
jgi:ssDNA-binding Zn-finger/Zn-ribbon topoisomerase 1